MTESEYNRLADALMEHLEQVLEDADIDYERAAGGILEVEFEDDSRIVINKQAAMQEIWVAARSGGYHFRWRNGHWHDSRSGEGLLAALGKMISQQAGRTVELA